MILPLLLLLAAGLNLACEDEPATEVSQIVFPETNVKYGAHVQPLFDRACAFTGCHGPDTYLEHEYSLESYQSLTSPRGLHDIVIPGDPENSMLIWSVEGIQGYEGNRRMPLNLPTLNDNQIRGLRRWIAEGARNN